MNTVVPLISSGVAGPLGVLHLPRLWLKLSLESVGKLAPGYPGAGKGYDQMVLDGVGHEDGGGRKSERPALGRRRFGELRRGDEDGRHAPALQVEVLLLVDRPDGGGVAAARNGKGRLARSQ